MPATTTVWRSAASLAVSMVNGSGSWARAATGATATVAVAISARTAPAAISSSSLPPAFPARPVELRLGLFYSNYWD